MNIEFDMVISKDKNSFKKKINEQLKKGWELHGELAVSRSMEDGRVQFVQAIIKKTNYSPYRLG